MGIKASELIERLRGGLIVSCQASKDEPLFGAEHMAAMAKAAVSAGAVAIRANGPGDIAAIRAVVDVPIIGIYKVDLPGYEVRITPSLEYALLVIEAGADIVAVDATDRLHPEVSAAELIKQIQVRSGYPVVADISTLEEGMAAASSGADLVATTLAGYTTYSPGQIGPDLALLEKLVAVLKKWEVPVIAEGRFAAPEQAAMALQLGAHAVVVGSAITRPQWITERFVEALRKGFTA